MKMTNSINDLIGVVQGLRTEKYPGLPENLITQILEIEAGFLDNQTEALKRIARVVDSYLLKEESE